MLGIDDITQKMKNTISKTNNDSKQLSKTIIGTLINQTLYHSQIFLNHIHERNKHDKQDTVLGIDHITQ